MTAADFRRIALSLEGVEEANEDVLTGALGPRGNCGPR